MLTVAEFYQAFDEAGFLVPCTWTPQPGGTPVPGLKVRYRAPSTQLLGDGGAIVLDPHARWPLGQLATARKGDRLDITVEGVVTSFRIRELHRVGGTGSQVHADLAAWT